MDDPDRDVLLLLLFKGLFRWCFSHFILAL
jgi:hypothetical protein